MFACFAWLLASFLRWTVSDWLTHWLTDWVTGWLTSCLLLFAFAYFFWLCSFASQARSLARLFPWYTPGVLDNLGLSIDLISHQSERMWLVKNWTWVKKKLDSSILENSVSTTPFFSFPESSSTEQASRPSNPPDEKTSLIQDQSTGCPAGLAWRRGVAVAAMLGVLGVGIAVKLAFHKPSHIRHSPDNSTGYNSSELLLNDTWPYSMIPVYWCTAQTTLARFPAIFDIFRQ